MLTLQCAHNARSNTHQPQKCTRINEMWHISWKKQIERLPVEEMVNWNWCDCRGNKTTKPLQVSWSFLWFCAPTVPLKCAKLLSKVNFHSWRILTSVFFFSLEINSQSIELIWNRIVGLCLTFCTEAGKKYFLLD